MVEQQRNRQAPQESILLRQYVNDQSEFGNGISCFSCLVFSVQTYLIGWIGSNSQTHVHNNTKLVHIYIMS